MNEQYRNAPTIFILPVGVKINFVYGRSRNKGVKKCLGKSKK
jgi:hypothetical protein